MKAAAAIAIGLAIGVGTMTNAQEKVCTSQGCFIVDVPREVLVEGRQVVSHVAKATKGVTVQFKTKKPVRSFLRRLFR